MRTTSNDRIHALDNLRGILAILGIPYHAALILYLRAIATPYADFVQHMNRFLLEPTPTIAKKTFFLVFYFHTFRMPAFFLLAGFFAHLLCSKKGKIHAFKNRLQRIALPFIFYFLWLAPLFFAKLFSVSITHQETIVNTFKKSVDNGSLWAYFNNTLNYWFLDYLLWFYAITLLFFVLGNYPVFPKRIADLFTTTLPKVFLSPIAYIIFPLICTSLFAAGQHWFIVTDENILPSLSLLLFYSTWYFLGWMLWQHQHTFLRLTTWAWQKFLLSLIFYCIYLVCYFHFFHTHKEWQYLLSLWIYNTSMLLGVFACLGFSWRYLSNYHSALRYLSRASYWLYLTQIPIVLVFIIMTLALTPSFYLQFFLTILLSTATCLLTYRVFIQKTWLRKIVG